MRRSRGASVAALPCLTAHGTARGIERSTGRCTLTSAILAQPAAGQSGAVIETQTHPGQYRHWKLRCEGPVAHLIMDVREDAGLHPGYELRLNSYDLGVDIELADAVTRLRFEHPEVSVVVLTSGKDNVFCAGANIFMLRQASHPFKVNFCKYTNETRLAMEEATRESGQYYLAALNGVCSGGGYELALACQEIHLIDDRSSAVSLPEAPYLGVLPGTGGLTRVVDKRHVRRDLADVFATLAEGVKGQRAKEWKLVDAVHPKSQWSAAIARRAQELVKPGRPQRGIALEPLDKRREADRIDYSHVTLSVDRAARTARLELRGPHTAAPLPAEPAQAGSRWYPLALFRELDDALVELRLNFETIGVLTLHAQGDLDKVLAVDELLARHRHDWFVREVLLLMRRTLKRLDLTARSVFALVEPGSCFGGFLCEPALAADRIYMIDDPHQPTALALSPLNNGSFPMGNGLARLAQRFLDDPARVAALQLDTRPRFSPQEALAAGLVTAAPDSLDWDDELRIAVEERASLSPDALTGMEANLRFAGPETMETKIFGRLSAWQNWIFQRPNATGERGALSLYGEPASPEFDPRRT
ncbi:MAG: benzoyl-CoA-dihydrodiol lyase [Candidatus Lambdaproteobacteria bacterium]|nr:benzoyl-CoA-dihydrodiol lyase [Candidatus Lambdaproteobacteria bacterium]